MEKIDRPGRRINRAQAVRDYILPLIRQHGRIERIGSGSIAMLKLTPFEFVLMTPFSKLDDHPRMGSDQEALL